MSIREKGFRRVTAVTVGLVAASVAGSVAAATLARADTLAHRSTGTSGTSSTGTTGTTGSTGSSTGAPYSPPLTNSGGQPHATSGGS